MGRSRGQASEEAPLLDSSQSSKQREIDALYRKLAFLLGPVSFAVSLSCSVNRANVGLAAMDMADDIGLSKSEIGTVSSLFFVTYMLFQIPSNIALVRVGGPIWLGLLIIGWGLVSALTAFVRNVTQLYTLRLFLGLFQAGAIPGIQYYITVFFPESRVSIVYGILFAGASAGMGLSSPLGAGLLAMDGLLNLHGWQWLFLLEGLPSVLLGVVVLMFLPKDPTSKPLCCKPFLTEREIEILQEDHKGNPQGSTRRDLYHQLKTTFLNGRLWLLLFICFLFGMARYIAMFWTPLWIASMLDGGDLGWGKEESTSVEAALFATIPYGVAAVAGCLFGWTSTKLNDRVYHCLGLLITSGAVFAFLPWLVDVHAALGFFALTMEHVGVNSAAGLTVSLASSCMANESKAFGMAWFNSIGNLNGVVGPMLIGILADASKSYKTGIWAVGGMTVLSGLLFMFVEDKLRKGSKRMWEIAQADAEI